MRWPLINNAVAITDLQLARRFPRLLCPGAGTSNTVRPNTTTQSPPSTTTTVIIRRCTRALLTAKETTMLGNVDRASKRSVSVPWLAYQGPKDAIRGSQCDDQHDHWEQQTRVCAELLAW